MPQCPGCGIQRKDITTPCSVCGYKPESQTTQTQAQPDPPIISATSDAPKIQAPVAGIRNSKPGKPICQACGGDMKKTTVTSGRASGCAMALIVMLLGIVLLFLFPIGTFFGIVLIFLSLFMGGKRQKVWKCVACSATVNRA